MRPVNHILPVILGGALASLGCDDSTDVAMGDSGSDAVAKTDTTRPDGGGDSTPLSWSPCSTADWPEGYSKPTAEVKCTTISVPVDHNNPGTRTLSLRVARHESKAFPTGKALFYLAGGPGGTAVGTSGVLPTMLPQIEQHFDLVYVDQRGTGGSGYMDCSAGYPQTKQEWQACAAEHTSKPLGFYLTSDAARDIDFVRKRLGYESVYLLGVSYGTTLALEYMRRFKSQVVAVVLDSVVPPDLDIMGESSKVLDNAIKRLVNDCTKDSACTAVSPTLAADLTARRAALKASPHKILVNGVSMLEDEETFIMLLDAALYYVSTRYLVPRAMHQAMQGSNTLWNSIISALTGYTVTDDTTSFAPAPGSAFYSALPLRPRRWPRLGKSYVAPGLHMTVVCGEWLPASGGAAKVKAIVDQQTWPMDTWQIIAEACSAWKVTPAPAFFRTPVTSATPALLLSGDLDLNTLPEWGTNAVKGLTHGSQVIIPYTAHATINASCPASIASAFLIADGQIGKVDTSCTKKITAPTW